MADDAVDMRSLSSSNQWIAPETPADAVQQKQEGVQQAQATLSAADNQELIPLISTAFDEAQLTPLEPIPGISDVDVVREMSTDEVLDYAVDHHPLLQVRRYEVEVAQADLVTAHLRPNPELVLDTQSPIHESGPTELSLRLEFMVPNLRKRRLRKAVACAGIQHARCALNQETELVLHEAADAAIEVLYLQKLLNLNAEISQLSAAVAATSAPTVDLRMGELQLVNKVTADMNAADAEVQHLDTSVQLTVARRRLALAIGLTPPQLPVLTDELVVSLAPLIPLETVLAIVRENNPEIAEARAALTKSQQQHALDHAEARPDAIMGPRYEDQLGIDDDRMGVRFSTDLPLFDRNQGVIRGSAAQVRTNGALLHVAEFNTLSDIASAYSELASIQKSLKFFNSHIAQLEEQTKSLLGREDIRNVISDYQVARIQLALAKMRDGRLRRQYRYQQLLVRLEVLLGRPLT